MFQAEPLNRFLRFIAVALSCRAPTSAPDAQGHAAASGAERFCAGEFFWRSPKPQGFLNKAIRTLQHVEDRRLGFAGPITEGCLLTLDSTPLESTRSGLDYQTHARASASSPRPDISMFRA